MRSVAILFTCLTALSGCLPLGLGGTIADHELGFVDVTYVELRGTDVATSTPFHTIDVWLMPMENSCARFDGFISDLSLLRTELDDGLPPDDYCDSWEALYDEFTGLDDFWVARFRLEALPRADGVTPATEYAFHDSAGEGQAEGPSFDADLAFYPAPTFDACATEFSGETFYGSTVYSATGGTATIKRYTEDESINFRLDPEAEEEGDEPLAGDGEATFCPAALEWGLQFGRGV